MALISHRSDRYLATPQLREHGDEVLLSLRAWGRAEERYDYGAEGSHPRYCTHEVEPTP